MSQYNLYKGFEVELFTGSLNSHIGVSAEIEKKFPDFVKEPDNRNVEYITTPEKDYGSLFDKLITPRKKLRKWLNTKNLKDSNSVKELIISELKIGQIRLDARLLLDFFDIFNEINDRKNLKINLQKLLSLDKWILSSKDSVEMREQQNQMAKSLFDLTKEFGFEYLYKKNKKTLGP